MSEFDFDPSIIQVPQEMIDAVFAPPRTREQLQQQAMKFLYDNQECYVAKWILDNPFANINDYRLKFVYNDETMLGYTVEMEKIQ